MDKINEITEGDYKLKKTGLEKTIAHPEGKATYEVHHNGQIIGKIKPYSSYLDKKKPGSRIVSSRKNITSYSFDFNGNHGPRSHEMGTFVYMGHSNPKVALQRMSKEHQTFKAKQKNEEVNLDENILNIQQRQKRAIEMRRNEPRIEIARERAKKKVAPEANIKKRSYAMARQLVRSRLTNVSQAEYAKMGPSEKMAIDRVIEKKGPAIKKLAMRLIPKVKKAEYARLQSYMHGQQMANHGAPEGNHVSESLNNLFLEYFGDSAPGNSGSTGERSDSPINSSGRKIAKSNTKGDSQGNAKGGTKTKGSPIVQYGKFGEDLEVDSPVFKALIKKADATNLDLEILGEVYNRGLEAWNEDCSVSQQQYAFARVNSYINQGRTYFNEDADLHELSKSTLKSYLAKTKEGGKQYPTPLSFRKSMESQGIAKGKLGLKYKRRPVPDVKIKATNEEVELQEDEAPAKVGDKVYLKTKVHANSPHTGKVKKVTPTHVHLDTGHGIYKAPHSAITKDYKQSHLHVNYGSKNEEVEVTEGKFTAHVSKNGRSHGTVKLSAIDRENAEYQMKKHPYYKHFTVDKVVKEENLEEKRGLWDNIHAKQKRIKAGSGERMRKPGSEGAPSNSDLKAAQESVDFEESKNTPYVKAYFEKGQTKQNSWKAMNKHGHVKHFGLPFKKAAELHAGLSEGVQSDFLDEMAGANMDRRALVSHITNKGWQKKASGGSGDHDVFTHPKSTHRLAVPRHNKLKAPLILDVLKKSKIMDKTNEEIESVDEHIVKVKSGYRLVSKSSGKNLGTYPTKEGAEKREKQVQYFKHQNEEVELDEVLLSSFKKTEKFGGKDLGKHISTIEGTKHIGTLENGHHVYHSYDPKDKMHDYHVVDPKTKRINIHLTTKQQAAPGAEEVSVLTANDKSLGAHHLYQHLVTKHNKIISSNDQSPGARSVWAKVGKHKGIHIHGYDPISKTTFHMKPSDDEEYIDRDNKEVNTVKADRKLTAPKSKDRAAHDAELEDLDKKKYTYIVMHKKSGLKEDLESYLSESTLPKSYTKGLTPAEIKAKKAHIERNNKLSDRDPDAYKDMPGDKRIREKGIPQSKYTKAYHAKFGESIENLDEDALADKAKKSGISLGTLKKVYRRGVAAWNSGHRPGTTPQQWGMARVNSYIAHGKGTYGGADKDLHEDDDRPIAVSRGETPRKKTQNVERDLTPQTPSNDAAPPKNPASDMFKQQQIKKKIIDEFDFSSEELDFFLEHGVEFGELLDEAVNPTKRQTKKLISRWHDKEQGQMYGDLPYSYHPKKVMNIGKRVFGTRRFGPATKKVALLHDTLEDTPHTPEDLKAKGFTPEVINAVKLLSKDKKLSYRDNIERIIRSGDKHAQMVKYADNMANYTGDKSGWDPEKRKASQAKYMDSMKRLGAVLGVNHHEKLDESDKPTSRLIGTDSLVKTYKKSTPGQKLDEAFNIAFAAGIGQTYTAADLGMKMQGGFAYHPSVLDQIEEDVVSAEKAPVVVPAHMDAYGNVIPAKTVLRKLGRKIIRSGNVHNGDTDQQIGDPNNG